MPPPPQIPIGSHHFPLNLDNRTIPELVSELRFTFLPSDFDRVEETLVVRESRLKEETERNNMEIRSLRDIIEIQKLCILDLELKGIKEEREKNEKKSVHERCEAVVKVEQNDGSGGFHFNDNVVTASTVGELRKRNSELEGEKCRLLELKRKWDADTGVVAGLRKRVSELEAEKIELLAEKRKWVGESSAIDELREENRRLNEEKLKAEEMVRSWEKRYSEFTDRFLKCKSGTEKGLVVVKGGGDPGGGKGNTTQVESPEGKREKKIMEDDVKPSTGAGTWKSPSIPRKKGVGASAKGRQAMGLVINIEDNDEDECNSQGASLQRKETPTSKTTAVGVPPSSSEVVKKNLPIGPAAPVGKFSRGLSSSREFVTNIVNVGSETSSSSSSSSSGSLDMDSLPLTSLRSNKKLRIEN